uniref:Uncharacterized protein n=1 Tax=Anguilla anguilla TaxID=7936 RepID=A0A0E9VZ60_ANGAN
MNGCFFNYGEKGDQSPNPNKGFKSPTAMEF